MLIVVDGVTIWGHLSVYWSVFVRRGMPLMGLCV
jgi:hypothetical protein